MFVMTGEATVRTSDGDQCDLRAVTSVATRVGVRLGEPASPCLCPEAQEPVESVRV